jgi:hypothetical protein
MFEPEPQAIWRMSVYGARSFIQSIPGSKTMSDDNAKAATKAETESDFRVFSACGPIEGVTFYFIESTAPDNVEQRVAGDDHPPEGLTLVEPNRAIMKIAEQLVPSDEPEVDANLVVMVHGFNNPRKSVLTFYRAAIEALKKDKDAIFSKSRRIVCIGYRCPSEARFSVLGSSLCALPLFPLWLFGGACAVLALRLWSWVASLPLLLFELALRKHPSVSEPRRLNGGKR